MARTADYPPTGFGVRLKALRTERGLTHDELAERACCARATINNLESGRHEPLWPVVIALCLALGCSPAEFFALEEITSGAFLHGLRTMPRESPKTKTARKKRRKA